MALKITKQALTDAVASEVLTAAQATAIGESFNDNLGPLNVDNTEVVVGSVAHDAETGVLSGELEFRQRVKFTWKIGDDNGWALVVTDVVP